MPQRGVPQRRKRQTARKEQENPTLMVAEDVEMVIEEMAQFRESKNIALYGPSGHGKTVFASGCPRSTFLTTEKGLSSAQRAGSTSGIMRAYDWPHILAGKRKADEVLGKDDWLIVDSGTKMQTLYMRWILWKENQQNSSRSLDIPSLPNHQQYQNGFKRFVDGIIDAQYNSLFVFGEMEIPSADDEDEMETVPHIEGGRTFQVCRYLIGQFDVGIRLSVSKSLSEPGNTVRLALTQPTTNHWAKDRYMALGDWFTIEPYDFGRMADIIDLIENPPDLYQEEEVALWRTAVRCWDAIGPRIYRAATCPDVSLRGTYTRITLTYGSRWRGTGRPTTPTLALAPG